MTRIFKSSFAHPGSGAEAWAPAGGILVVAGAPRAYLVEEHCRGELRQAHLAHPDAVRGEAAVPGLDRTLVGEQDTRRFQVHQGEEGLGPGRTRAAGVDPVRDGRQDRVQGRDVRVGVVHAQGAAAAGVLGAAGLEQTVGRGRAARRGLGGHLVQASVERSKGVVGSSRRLS